MDYQKLNSLYVQYRKPLTNKNCVFEEIYEELRGLKAINRSIVLRSRRGDENDALTIFDETLLKLLSKDGINDFGRAFERSLRNARYNLFRNSRRRTEKLKWIDETIDDEEGAATPYLLKSDFDLEREALKKKEADKISFVDFLLESSKILFGPKMTAIIRGLPDYGSVNDAATSNGLKRNQLSRPLEYLARKYDPKIHGDISDYFPEGVRVKRKYITA